MVWITRGLSMPMFYPCEERLPVGDGRKPLLFSLKVKTESDSVPVLDILKREEFNDGKK